MARLQRSLVVIDRSDRLPHAPYEPDQDDQPDYDKTVTAVSQLAG